MPSSEASHSATASAETVAVAPKRHSNASRTSRRDSAAEHGHVLEYITLADSSIRISPSRSAPTTSIG